MMSCCGRLAWKREQRKIRDDRPPPVPAYRCRARGRGPCAVTTTRAKEFAKRRDARECLDFCDRAQGVEGIRIAGVAIASAARRPRPT